MQSNSNILDMDREIALALAAKEVRIEAPIPGKAAIGILVAFVGLLIINLM